MNKGIVFKICLLLIIFACVLPSVFAYNTLYDTSIATEGESKGNIIFTRTSVASETTRENYLKIAGKYGTPIKGGAIDIPTTSTYQIAYYMFTKAAFDEEKNEYYNPNPVIIQNDELSENTYGYLNGSTYVQAKIEANPAFNIEKCVENEKVDIPINRYIKDSAGDYVISETPDSFFRYTVTQICIIKKKDKDDKIYYELQETIALDASATDKLQQAGEAATYYITPVFYTKGLPSDIPNSENQSIYADQYFYAYTLNEFFQMKLWDSSVGGNDGKGIYSVINQIDNIITIPAKNRTEEIIVKYVRLTDRNMVTPGEWGDLILTSEALKLDPIEITRYTVTNPSKEYTVELDPKVIIEDSAYFDGDKNEVIGYVMRQVNSEAELVVDRENQLTELFAGDNTIEVNQEKLVVEIIVYSIPKMLDCTLTVNHETWHRPDTKKDVYEKMSDIEVPQDKVVRIRESGPPEKTSPELVNVSTGINGLYNFQVKPSYLTNQVYIEIPIYPRDHFTDIYNEFNVEWKISGAVEHGKKEETINGRKTTTALIFRVTSQDVNVTVQYKVYRGNNSDVLYDGKLMVDTTSGQEVECNSILSIPNQNMTLYLGLDKTLLHYVKGIHYDPNYISNSNKIEPSDNYDITYTVNITDPLGDVNVTQIKDSMAIRLHTIAQVAIFSIKNIEYFNPTKDENGRNLYDTLGDKILDLNGNVSYTQSFDWKDAITIDVKGPTQFIPQYFIVRNHHYYSSSGDTLYPMKFSVLYTLKDFKENLMDVISPYAFTEINPYARELLDFKYEYKNYEFEECMSDMINNALQMGSDVYWRGRSGDNKYRLYDKNMIINLDFSKLYVVNKNKGTTDKKLDYYYDTIDDLKLLDFKLLDKNRDGVIDKKDLELVYKATNDAYVDYILGTTTKKSLEGKYIEECKFVEVYDEAVLMQAMSQMLSNLNDLGWIQMSGLALFAKHDDATAKVTINDNQITGENKTSSIVNTKQNQERTQSFYELFTSKADDITFTMSSLYSENNSYLYYNMDYDTIKNEFFARKFNYWGVNRQEIREYKLSAYKKENGVVTALVKDSTMIAWGYIDKANGNKFVPVERFFTGTLKEEDYKRESLTYKGAQLVTTKPTDDKMQNGITIVEGSYTTLHSSGSTDDKTKDYKNNVSTPIKNISDNFSKVFNTGIINLLATKYTKLSEEVSVKDLKTICNGNSTKLKKLVNATMVNSENVFNNVYGLENLSAKVAALNDKSVAEYVIDDSIVKSGDIRQNIIDASLPKMKDKIFVDIDKMFMKNFVSGNYKYMDTYGKIYLDDVLIYIINNFETYYYSGLYDDCKALCNGFSGDKKTYFNGLLSKIQYLTNLKNGTAGDKEVYEKYLEDMSYAKMLQLAKNLNPADEGYIKTVSFITSDLMGKVGENAIFKNIVNGFEAYLKAFGTDVNNTTYNYYSVLSDNITAVTNDGNENLNISLNYIFMQDSKNAIANFDIHFDAYQAYYNYWITTGEAGSFSDTGNEPYEGVSGGKGFLTARSIFRANRLAVNQNAYTGYSGEDKWSDDRQNKNNNEILSQRSELAHFKKLAGKNEKNENLYKNVIKYTENGKRNFAAKVTYSVTKLYKEENKNTFKDNVFDGTSAWTWRGVETQVDPNRVDTYYYGVSNNNSMPINVYTPIYVEPDVKTSLIKPDNQKIPASKFEMTFSQKLEDTSEYYNVSTEESTKNLYYIRFKFDVFDVKYTSALNKDKIVSLPGTIKSGTWIGPVNSMGPNDANGNATSGYISGAVSGLGKDFHTGYNVLAIQHTVGNKDFAFDEGARDDLTKQLMSYSKVEDIKNSALKAKLDNICADKIYKKNNALDMGTYYIHEGDIDFQLQIYDFKVTDVTDPSWKSSFRVEENGYTHSKRAYYSGTRIWNYMAIGEEEGASVSFVDREQSQLGDFSNNILPIGPYKNSKLTYAYAPKLRLCDKL